MKKTWKQPTIVTLDVKQTMWTWWKNCHFDIRKGWVCKEPGGGGGKGDDPIFDS